MLELVTLDDAAVQLRLDTNDPWLAIFIPAVSQAVASWLKDSWRLYMPELDAEGNVVTDSGGFPIPLEDSSGPILNPVVKAAVLVELASQYRFREGDESQQRTGDLYSGRYGYILCTASTNLLQAIRKGTIA